MVDDFSNRMDSQPDQSLSLTPSGTSLLEINAARLMDELFQELEQNLDHPQAVPTHPQALPPKGSLAVTPSPELTAPAPATDELFVPYAHLESTVDPRTQGPSTPYFLPGHEPESPARLVWFGLGCICMMAAAGLWVGTQMSLRQQTQLSAAAPASAPELPAVDPETAQFAAYVQRSLQRIDHKTASTQTAAATATATTAPPAVPGVPNIDIASSTGQLPANAERVYIPIYQPPNPQAPAPSTSANPSSANPPSANPPSAPQANSTPEPAQINAAKTAPLTTTHATQQLIGVVEMGEHSVALVSNNGATRRVKPGELLDDSGLTLVKIDGDKAMVQRNGTVHALSVGQNF